MLIFSAKYIDNIVNANEIMGGDIPCFSETYAHIVTKDTKLAKEYTNAL